MGVKEKHRDEEEDQGMEVGPLNSRVHFAKLDDIMLRSLGTFKKP